MSKKDNTNEVELCPEFTGSRKITAIQMTLLWQILKSDTSCPSSNATIVSGMERSGFPETYTWL